MTRQELFFGMLVSVVSPALVACGDDSPSSQESANGGSGNTSADSGGSGANSSSSGGSTTANGGSGNNSSSSTSSGGSSTTGGSGSTAGGTTSTTAPADAVRGAATLVLEQLSNCGSVGTIEMPTVTSGHAVTASGASQTLYSRQPLTSVLNAEADCQMGGTVAGGDLMAVASLGNENARITLGVDKMAVGAPADAGLTLASAVFHTSYQTSNDGPFCRITVLKATETSFLAKLTCSQILGSAANNEKCAVSESYVTFENCTRPWG